jgi:hypothetical protein
MVCELRAEAAAERVHSSKQRLGLLAMLLQPLHHALILSTTTSITEALQWHRHGSDMANAGEPASHHARFHCNMVFMYVMQLLIGCMGSQQRRSTWK